MDKITKLSKARIVGIITCLPRNKINNDYFLDFLNQSEIDNIEKKTGVKTRYWVGDESTVDLCVAAGKELLKKLKWSPVDVDAIILVTQSPDYVLPASSIKIAGQLGLSEGVIAYDVNLGCSGYPYGLFLAETMIASGIARKILFMVGETTSKIIDKKDKSTALIFGDAGAATAIEYDENEESIYLLGSDASGEKNLIVPNSRFSKNNMLCDPRMNGRNYDYIFMDGAEIFNFTLKRVPPLVKKMDELSNNSIEYYLFHQANKFMLNHLVRKMRIREDQVPLNIEEFGNTSSASIPLLLTTVMADKVKSKKLTKIGMFGFGVGYSWAACVKNLNSDIVLENLFIK